MDIIATGTKVRLREKRLPDARNDYIWQTDPELVELDAATVLLSSYHQYELDYANSLHYASPLRYAFAIDTFEGEHIGNCTCYDIDEPHGEAQLGIIIGNRQYWDKGYGVDAMNALVDYVLLNTRLTRLYLKTLDWNIRAQTCFEKCGFKPCGRLYQDSYPFLVMELHRNQWDKFERRRGQTS
ncbi:MAG: GNAT family protein [Dehalococcoidales bacterium]|nr:GNAT family protein [Dehalococcoidales bacterium]